MVAHHFGNAPQNALTEPTADNVLADARAVEQVPVTGDDAARADELPAPRPHERPDQAHGRARHRAAANPDGIAVAHKRGRLLQRHYLLAQATVPLLEVFS